MRAPAKASIGHAVLLVTALLLACPAARAGWRIEDVGMGRMIQESAVGFDGDGRLVVTYGDRYLYYTV
jgi:hypothetical protein